MLQETPISEEGNVHSFGDVRGKEITQRDISEGCGVHSLGKLEEYRDCSGEISRNVGEDIRGLQVHLKGGVRKV